jgi:hypothetical protein
LENVALRENVGDGAGNGYVKGGVAGGAEQLASLEIGEQSASGRVGRGVDRREVGGGPFEPPVEAAVALGYFEGTDVPWVLHWPAPVRV